jgi:hypothetical protein
MRFYIFLLTVTLFFTACGGNNEAPKPNANIAKPINANVANVNVTTSGTNTNLPITAPNSNVTTAKPETPKVNEAQTLISVMTAYSEALKTKNDAALKKIMSASAVKGWEDEMKSEGKTKFAEYVASSVYVEGKPYEIRNEAIKGDEAVAEVKGGVYGKWTPIVFVKENGEWKITDESPDFSSVKEAANTAQKIK